MSSTEAKEISLDTWKRWRSERRTQLIDVRSATEFAAGHLPGAINIPLEQIELRTDDLDSVAAIVVVCQGGTRARCARALLAPVFDQTHVLDGGTDGWTRAGNPIVRNICSRWSLEPQVRLAAGMLIILGTAFGLAFSHWWWIVPALMGCGLTFAGSTAFCPMGELLAKLPWNRTRRSPGTAMQSSSGLSCAFESGKRT
jgi:rhodanese-related sulfurtransferase